MAGTIKGITIEFNGDTTKLDKALTKVDKETKNVDKSLKEVKNALKFNPGNTELLAQKQTLLKKRIDETTERLKVLRAAQEKLDDDPSVDKTSQEYMELRREIIETESKLKHFESELKKMDNIKFEQLGKQVQDVGDKMKTVGTNMTKYVTGPILAGAGASVAAFKEVDEGLDIIVEKTGASGKALDAMKDSAKNLAQEIPTDFETAGSAIGEVNTRFGLTGEALEDLSGKFIKFAQLNDTDVSTSVDNVQKAMAAFGVPTEEAGNMLDLLNKVGQDTGISMDALAESLVKNAPQLQAMGLTANQAATFLGQLEVSGIDSSKAMTGLNKAIVQGAKDGKTLPEVMDGIKDSIVNAASETDAMNAAIEIFGSKAGPAIATAARNGSLDFDALTSSVTEAAGSVENTFNETLDPADKFTMMMNSLKVTGYEVGATILEIVAPALEKLANFLKGLADKWKELSPQTQGFIIKMAGIVSAVGPVLVVVGTLITKVGMLITYLPAIIGLFSKATSIVGIASKAFALMTGPVGLVIAAIAALIAIGILLYKNWDTIKEKAGEIWGAIKTAIANAVEGIKQVIETVWNGIKTITTTVWEGIKLYFQTLFNIYKTIFTAGVNALKTVITTVFNGIKTYYTTLFNIYKTIFSKGWDVIKNITSKAWNGIKNAMVTPFEKAKDLIKAIIDKIKGFLDFKFKLPHIKLPHFAIQPSGWNVGDLLKGVIPTLGINWYAKGAIFKKPIVIGDKGFAEAGDEAAVPLDPFWDKMDKIVEAVENGSGDKITINVYASPGMDIEKLADEVEKRMTRIQKQKGRAFA